MLGKHPNFLLKYFKCDEKLNIFYNSYSSTRWAVQLYTSLRDNSKLTHLRVGDNNISDDVCSVICEELSINATLTVLYIWGNPLTEECLRLIMKALQYNDTLHLLDVSAYTKDIRKLNYFSNLEMRSEQAEDVI